MAQRGRKTDKSQPLATDEARALPSYPVAPEHFGEWCRKRWDAIVRARAVDYFNPTDFGLLEQLVFSEFICRECTEAIAEHGTVIGGPKGRPVRNPSLDIRRQALVEVHRAQQLLRLCPSKRYGPKKAKLRPDEGPAETEGNLWD